MEDPEAAKKALNACYLIVAQGLTIKISTDEVKRLTEFTLKYFKHLTVDDISIAFELLAAKKFDIKSNGHFGVLSREYIGDVLKSYADYLASETRKEQLALGTLDPDQERILTPEEEAENNEKAIRESLIASWNYFKENGTMEKPPALDLMGGFHYDWLRHHEFMGKPEGELKESIRTEAAEYLQKELSLMKRHSDKDEEVIIGDLIERIFVMGQGNKFKSTCAKIAVRCYFEELIIESKELEDIIV